MRHTDKMITVVQGEFAVSKDPDVILSTVLGSCVAVCLFDARAKIGGMNHFLLAGTTSARNNDLRYGVNAMELLINQMLQTGAVRQNLVAKLFGGARMTAHAVDIGQSNAQFARGFLEQEGIPCLAHSLGGDMARRVHFCPATGAARQMQISGDLSDLAPAPPKKPPAPDITLF